MAKLAKLQVYRENSRDIKLTFQGISLAGATVYFTVKSGPDDDADDNSAFIQKNVTSHSDPDAGETVVRLTPSDTDIEAGDYKYDVKLKLPDGSQSTLGVADFIVLPAITNRG